MGRGPRAAAGGGEVDLHAAARSGDLNAVQSILRSNPLAINSRDKHSRTPYPHTLSFPFSRIIFSFSLCHVHSSILKFSILVGFLYLLFLIAYSQLILCTNYSPFGYLGFELWRQFEFEFIQFFFFFFIFPFKPKSNPSFQITEYR